MTLYVCSTNPGKLADFALGLPELHLEMLPGLDRIAPPIEDGNTFEENARIKAVYYSGFTSAPVLTDDSGIEVEALNGAPGIYSARYAGEGATDQANNNLLRRNLEGDANRRARYVCVLAVAQQGAVWATSTGMVEGEILIEPVGPEGFGYDPLFFHPPSNRSFGEITREQRFQLSARGNALRALPIDRLTRELASSAK